MRKRILILYCFGFISCLSTKTQGPVTQLYPLIESKTTIDTSFGNSVMDEFSSLNILNNPDVQDWFQAQDSLSENFFSGNSFMGNYLEKFNELQSAESGNVTSIKISESGNYFYLKFNELAGANVLYYRQNRVAEEVALFNPLNYDEDLKDITYFNPSFDGNKVAIGFKSDDTFSSTIYILEVKTKHLFPDIITNINPDYGGVEWLPDSTGFIYLYFPVVDSSLEGFKMNTFSVLHMIGDDPEDRRQIFGNDKGIDIPTNYYPKVKIGSSQDKYVIGYSASSSDYYDAYIAKLENVMKGEPNWLPFFKEEHQVFYNQGEVRNGEFIFRQGSIEGNRIARVKLENADFDNPEMLAEGTSENPITQFEVTKDNIYFAKSQFGVDLSLWQINQINKIKILEIPFPAGYGTFFGASVINNFIGIELDGWTSDYTRYIICADGEIQKEGLQSDFIYPEYEKLISEQIMVKSHDGVEVPLSLIYRKDLEKNSANEVFVYVYGAYGESMSPFFFPIFLNWAVEGGVLAFPHVRGGGEKGKEWHMQGMKQFKYNSWKDLIASSEELIEKGFTSKGLISVYTSSAGGVTAGMAVNERPDLFSSLIAEVPRMHPWGLESSASASSTSYLEYGTVKDSVEYIGLMKMDPYLNIREGVPYPAVLIMPSFQDDRIPLWDSGKYIAKLQKFSTGTKPILLDIDFVSGHQNYGNFDEAIKNYSKIFSFARSNMIKK